jgi:hypothetical protein
MVRPVLALERLLFLEQEGRVGYRHGPDGAELERMDYLEFIARVTFHIPDKGQVMVRYYGLYANAHRSKVRKASRVPAVLGLIDEDPPPLPSRGWDGKGDQADAPYSKSVPYRPFDQARLSHGARKIPEGPSGRKRFCPL